jgi:hypothetical protein
MGSVRRIRMIELGLVSRKIGGELSVSCSGNSAVRLLQTRRCLEKKQNINSRVKILPSYVPHSDCLADLSSMQPPTLSALTRDREVASLRWRPRNRFSGRAVSNWRTPRTMPPSVRSPDRAGSTRARDEGDCRSNGCDGTPCPPKLGGSGCQFSKKQFARPRRHISRSGNTTS